MKKITTRYKKSLVFLLLCASAFVALPFIKVSASGIITGRVFQDYNGNGMFDTSSANSAIDVGIGGVTVTVYDSAGTIQGTATTCRGLNNPTTYCTGNNNGMYRINATGTGPYRVEFATATLPPGYFPSARSTDSVDSGTTNGSGTTVQFVRDGNNELVNLAINHPDDYCQNNPDICVNQYMNGDNDENDFPGIWRVKYSASGAYSATSQISIANNQDVGATWGLAYSKIRKRLYSSAFLKRHVGLENGALGAIYSSDINPSFSSQTANAVSFAFIPNVGTIGSNNARNIDQLNVPNNDPTAFPQIGKIGLGDIEISQDENTLYAVNLNDKKLYSINLNTNAKTSILIRNPRCVGGEWRPFALGRHRADLYVGGVCDASSSQLKSDLRAVIYRFDPVPNTFTPVLNYSLDFQKGISWGGCDGGWFPWLNTNSIPNSVNTPDTSDQNCSTATVYPQPILSDIVIDNDGSMIMGFVDRTGHQLGANNYGLAGTTPYYNVIGGDILRASANSSGGFTLENNGSVGGLTGASNGEGPGGGEFYFEDHFYSNGCSNGGICHEENAEGGLAMLPGAKNVVATFMDPYMNTASGSNNNSVANTSGVRWLNNETGKYTKGYAIHAGSSSIPTNPSTFGKSNGVGDVEILCDLAPIEIGNRVWLDIDGDGIQDAGAGEIPLPGVTVRLFNSSNSVIATAVTNAAGEYYFSSATGTSSGNTIYNLPITPNTNYQIRLDNSANYTGTGPLAGRFLTIQNVSSNSMDSIDSDAANVLNPTGSTPGTFPVISFTTGGAGSNNHTLDIGFKTSNTTGGDTSSEDCCDKMKVTPYTFGPINQSWRTFEIYNLKSPASDICSIDIAFSPTTPGGFWTGGDLYIWNGTSQVFNGPPTWMLPYNRIPIGSGNIAGKPSSPTNPSVKFNLGIDNSIPYTGTVSLTVRHCDGSICTLRYNPWINTQTTTGGGNPTGVVPWKYNVKDLSAELAEVTLTYEGGRERISLPEGGKGAKWLGLQLADESKEIYSVDGVEWLEQKRENRKFSLSSASKNGNSALLEFSGLLNVNNRESNGRTITFLVRKKANQKIEPKEIVLTLFDENSNTIIVGNPRP